MGWFHIYKKGDPVRMVSNVEETNRAHNIFNDIKGIGCRIEKPRGANGLGWRIIVDGSSDTDPIPDSSVGNDTGQIPYKPYDLRQSLGVPRGGIIAWSGTIASVPNGWALCDGTNGTPNLAGKFILGAIKDTGATDTTHPVAVGSEGGTPYNTNGEHHHTLESAMGGGYYLVNGTVTATIQAWKFADPTVGTNPSSTLSPWYALAFIMKL